MRLQSAEGTVEVVDQHNKHEKQHQAHADEGHHRRHEVGVSAVDVHVGLVEAPDHEEEEGFDSEADVHLEVKVVEQFVCHLPQSPSMLVSSD